MQPDSMKPAARIPEYNFQRRHGYFQSKLLRSQRTILRPKRDDFINPIIRKNR